MKKEPRSVRYGKAEGYDMLSKLPLIPESARESWLLEILEGIKRLRYAKRKQGEPLKKEHRRPLDGLVLDELDYTSPQVIAKFYDEKLQLKYTEQRANEIKRGTLEVLNEAYRNLRRKK